MFLAAPFPQLLCGSGLVLFVVSTRLLSWRTQGAVDPLRAGNFTGPERSEIRGMIRHRILPGDTTLKWIVYERARYSVSAGVSILHWAPFVYRSLILILFGFYLLPAIALVALGAQLLLLILGLFQTISSARFVQNSREVLASDEFRGR